MMDRFILRPTCLLKGFLFIILFYCFSCTQNVAKETEGFKIRLNRFHSVRFDPSYYYNRDQKVVHLCNELTGRWRRAGINAVYVKAYDPLYGAVYSTKYPMNIETDFGRLDLMKQLSKACHRENIRVYAWIPAFLHKQVWEAHPEWRVKRNDGSDYRISPDNYPLCTRHPEYRRWWSGFVEEILARYPEIDGVDIAEPVVSWKEGEGCFCDACREAEKRWKAEHQSESLNRVRLEPLTSLLAETVRRVRAKGKSTSITSVMTAHTDGRLYSPQEQRDMTGFDLNAVLDSPDKPDIFNAEIIWQQYADVYRDNSTFTPAWTSQALAAATRQVRGRANLVAHVELTRMGGVAVPNDRFCKSAIAAADAGAWGIDFYDAFQADTMKAWDGICRALGHIPLKTVLVYYDLNGENDARQLEVLLRHFETKTTLVPLEKTFTLPNPPRADVVFYIGETIRKDLPEAFLRFIRSTDAIVCWFNHNLEHLGGAYTRGMGFRADGLLNDSRIQVLYRGVSFPKTDSLLNRIAVLDSTSCRVMAFAKTGKGTIPYAVRSGRFWYFADLPTAYTVEGSHHIVFSDLLHDLLKEDHEEKHLALVRIEDLSPLSDPASLRSIAKYLGAKGVPFSLGLSPYYLDPASNASVSLSDRPEFAKALRYAVSKGGTVVLHGCTHQYRGQTTDDYEFWDGLNDAPIFQDSREYVRQRIDRAVDECVRNGIYPLVWETPHYAASLLDYEVIDGYFSTVYERRQTMDVRGSDQLLPFFIPARNGKPQFIPENLGYIPLDSPDPAPMIENARQNLAVRDGFASFFFHPFVPLSVLKTLVKRIGDLGYSFASIRSLDNRLQTATQIVATGHYAWSAKLENQYLEEFLLNPAGRRKNRTVSPEKINDQVSKNSVCPLNWLYVARAVDQPADSSRSSLWTKVSRSPVAFNRLWHLSPLKAQNTPAVPLVLIDSKAAPEAARDQASYLSAFQSVGIDCRSMAVSDFFEIPEGVNLIVIPKNAADQLSDQQSLFIIDALAKGMNLILEKESELASRIGIQPIGEEKPVTDVQDEYYPQVVIRWKQKGLYRNFKTPIGSVTYYSEKDTKDPIVVGGEYMEGNYLFFADTFDPLTSEGYGRFPYFCDLLQRQFGLWPLVRNETAEVYFEPGDREDVSIEDLVKMWKQNGFHTIYAAGWHVYPEWTYDYGRLIELAHENAMLVYLWLELPNVNQKFWNDHPGWREITVTGREAVVDWRHLMALTVDSCKQAAMEEIAGLIGEFDWDGINLAELYFESADGPERPDVFTPMHGSVRKAFAAQSGFDPIELFNQNSPHFWKRNRGDWEKFQEYRKQAVVDLHRDFLAFLHRTKIGQKKDLEIVVTVVDNLVAKKTGEYTATDTRRLLALGKTLPFVLQIEDPQELWHFGPDRYRNLSGTYRAMQTGGEFILDVNVVPFRDWNISLAPTRQPTGMELSQLIRGALQDSNRVALYSESSIYEVDLPWIAYTLGSHSEEILSPTRWEINSTNKVVLYVDPKQHRNIRVNGSLWPACWKGKVILPSGHHVIEPIRPIEEFRNTFTESARIVDMSGNLRACRMVRQGLELSYNASVSNYLTVNERPRNVIVDGKPYSAGIQQGIPGFTIQLPAGTHSARILTSSIGSLTLKTFSIIASVLIVLVSSIAGTLLMVLYVGRSRRRRSRSKKE